MLIDLTQSDICQEVRRRFIRSFLDITIMCMLSKEPLWGYRMMTVLKDTYGVKVSPPTIYPLLDSMEERGLIEGEVVLVGRRKRKLYRTTEKGTELVKCLESVVSEIM